MARIKCPEIYLKGALCSSIDDRNDERKTMPKQQLLNPFSILLNIGFTLITWCQNKDISYYEYQSNYQLHPSDQGAPVNEQRWPCTAGRPHAGGPDEAHESEVTNSTINACQGRQDTSDNGKKLNDSYRIP